MRRYFATRRERVTWFVDRHFTLRGSARMHRRAFGLDLLRAPANVALVIPKAATLMLAWACERAGAQRAGRWLAEHPRFLQTDLARELNWLFFSELLELPYADGPRCWQRDALAETVLEDEEVASLRHALLAAAAERYGAGEARQRLEQAVASYLGARAAVADITNSVLLSGTAALAFQAFAPGALSFGPVVAASLTQQAAVASFPFGATLGSAWYAMVPARPSFELVMVSTTAVVLAAALLATFSGVLADPVQRRLGMHRRRLLRLLRHLEEDFLAIEPQRFTVRDHYAARLIDLVELLRLGLP